MTRTTQILALLISLVTLAVLAPTAGAATTPDPYRYADPQGWRAGSLDPNPRGFAAQPNPRFSPNPRATPNPRGYVTPSPRFTPNPLRRIVDPNPYKRIVGPQSARLKF